MKRNTFCCAVILFVLLLSAYPLVPVFSENGSDDISRVKLKEERLPLGMSIAKEVWASQKELLKKRMRIGLPLDGLLNQTIIYGADQARVNYLDPPSEEWLEFGYAHLIKTDGSRSLVATKDGVIVQIAVTSQGFENIIVRLLQPDLLHTYRIRTHRLPQDWVLIGEKFLQSDELRRLEHAAGVQIKQALMQEFIVSREEVVVKYYQTDTALAAEQLARQVAKKGTPLTKRSVHVSGVVIVAAESQSSDLNEAATALVNW